MAGGNSCIRPSFWQSLPQAPSDRLPLLQTALVFPLQKLLTMFTLLRKREDIKLFCDLQNLKILMEQQERRRGYQ